MPIIVDLRLPPSTNRFWRGTGRTVVHSSPYTGLRAADAHTVMTAQLRGVRQICGPFAADIVVQRGRGVRRDLDNYCKPLMDDCESRLAVRNDRDLQDLRMRWV